MNGKEAEIIFQCIAWARGDAMACKPHPVCHHFGDHEYRRGVENFAAALEQQILKHLDGMAAQRQGAKAVQHAKKARPA